jgi:hypothetical protein
VWKRHFTALAGFDPLSPSPWPVTLLILVFPLKADSLRVNMAGLVKASKIFKFFFFLLSQFNTVIQIGVAY